MFSSGCLLNCIFYILYHEKKLSADAEFLSFLPDWNLIPLNSYHSPVASRFLALHPSFPPTTSSRSLFFPVITLSPLYYCLLPVLSFLFHHSHSRRRPPRFMPSFCPCWVLSLAHTHACTHAHTHTHTAHLPEPLYFWQLTSPPTLPGRGKMLQQPCFLLLILLPLLLLLLLNGPWMEWRLFIRLWGCNQSKQKTFSPLSNNTRSACVDADTNIANMAVLFSAIFSLFISSSNLQPPVPLWLLGSFFFKKTASEKAMCLRGGGRVMIVTVCLVHLEFRLLLVWFPKTIWSTLKAACLIPETNISSPTLSPLCRSTGSV